jgi:hypothetical protein
VESHPHFDIFVYSLFLETGGFPMTVIICSIDSSVSCDPSSNADFVHFIRQNFESLTFKDYAITKIPTENALGFLRFCISTITENRVMVGKPKHLVPPAQTNFGRPWHFSESAYPPEMSVKYL